MSQAENLGMKFNFCILYKRQLYSWEKYAISDMFSGCKLCITHNNIMKEFHEMFYPN